MATQKFTMIVQMADQNFSLASQTQSLIFSSGSVRPYPRNQGRFRRPPKGPIGAMIRLKDYKWSRAVEQVVSRNLLSAFITDNATDDALLKQIMRDVLRNNPFKPDTICSRFEVCVCTSSLLWNVGCGYRCDTAVDTAVFTTYLE